MFVNKENVKQIAHCSLKTWFKLSCWYNGCSVLASIALSMILREVTFLKPHPSAFYWQPLYYCFDCCFNWCCHDFRQSRPLSLFRRRSAVDVTDCLVMADPLSLFCIRWVLMIKLSRWKHSFALLRLTSLLPVRTPDRCSGFQAPVWMINGFH